MNFGYVTPAPPDEYARVQGGRSTSPAVGSLNSGRSLKNSKTVKGAEDFGAPQPRLLFEEEGRCEEALSQPRRSLAATNGETLDARRNAGDQRLHQARPQMHGQHLGEPLQEDQGREGTQRASHQDRGRLGGHRQAQRIGAHRSTEEHSSLPPQSRAHQQLHGSPSA